MRLLLLSTEFPPGPGGIGTHAFELARQLTTAGWTITVVTPQDYVSAEEADAFNQTQPFSIVRLRPAPGAPLKLISRWLAANRVIQQFQPRALVASGERAGWLGHWLARRHQLPWVAVGHGSEFAARPRWKFNLTRSAFEHASRVVCVSQFTAGQMTGIGIRPLQTLVVPNGADAARFTVLPEDATRAFRKKIGLPGAQLLLTVGVIPIHAVDPSWRELDFLAGISGVCVRAEWWVDGGNAKTFCDLTDLAPLNLNVAASRSSAAVASGKEWRRLAEPAPRGGSQPGSRRASP